MHRRAKLWIQPEGPGEPRRRVGNSAPAAAIRGLVVAQTRWFVGLLLRGGDDFLLG